MSKLFKFWRYRLELKLSKISDKDKVEFLANELVKELNLNIDPVCENVMLWIHRKEKLQVSMHSGNSEINCKYTGK